MTSTGEDSDDDMPPMIDADSEDEADEEKAEQSLEEADDARRQT